MPARNPGYAPRGAPSSAPTEHFYDRFARDFNLGTPAYVDKMSSYFWLKEMKFSEPIGLLTFVTLNTEKMGSIDQDTTLNDAQRMRIRRLEGAILKFEGGHFMTIFPSVAPVSEVEADQVPDVDPALADSVSYTTLPGGVPLRMRIYQGEALYATDSWVGGFSDLWRVQVSETLRLHTLLIESCGITTSSQIVLNRVTQIASDFAKILEDLRSDPSVNGLAENVDNDMSILNENLYWLESCIAAIFSHPEDVKRDIIMARDAKIVGESYVLQTENSGIDVVLNVQKAVHAVIKSFYVVEAILKSASQVSDLDWDLDPVVENLDNYVRLITGDILPGQMYVFQIASGRKCITNKFWDEFITLVRVVEVSRNTISSLDYFTDPTFNVGILPWVNVLNLTSTGVTVQPGIYRAPRLSIAEANLVLARGYTNDSLQLASPLSCGETVTSADGTVLYKSTSYIWRRLVTRNNNAVGILLAELWKLVRTEQFPTADCQVPFGALIGSNRTIWDMYPVSLINYYIERCGALSFVQYGLTTSEFSRPNSGFPEFTTAAAFPLSQSAESYGYSDHIFRWVSGLFSQAVSPQYFMRVALTAVQIPLAIDFFFDQIENIRESRDIPDYQKNVAVESIVPPVLNQADQDATKTFFKNVLARPTSVESKCQLADDLAEKPSRLAKIVDFFSTTGTPNAV